MSDPLVKEFPVQKGRQGDADFAEHAGASLSKKTISGPLCFAADDASTMLLGIAPISVAVSAASILVPGLVANKTYRMISDQDCYFRQHNMDAFSATIGDIYLPAKTEMYISTTYYRNLSVIAGGSGKLNLVQLAD